MDFFGISLACLDPDGCMVRGSTDYYYCFVTIP